MDKKFHFRSLRTNRRSSDDPETSLASLTSSVVVDRMRPKFSRIFSIKNFKSNFSARTQVRFEKVNFILMAPSLLLWAACLRLTKIHFSAKTYLDHFLTNNHLNLVCPWTEFFGLWLGLKNNDFCLFSHWCRCCILSWLFNHGSLKAHRKYL